MLKFSHRLELILVKCVIIYTIYDLSHIVSLRNDCEVMRPLKQYPRRLFPMPALS